MNFQTNNTIDISIYLIVQTHEHPCPIWLAIFGCVISCSPFDCNLTFYRCINDCTKAELSNDTVQLLNSMIRQEPPKDATILCCLNRNVSLYNAIKLAELRSTRKSYKSQDSGSARLLQGLTSAEKILNIKTGAPVILTVSLPEAPNGSKGYVTALDTDAISVVVNKSTHLNIKRFLFKCTSPNATATRLQFPLKLAWSLSIHRAQGQTLDRVHIDCEGLFLPAMLPVALSRARCTADVTISNLCIDDILPVPDLVERWCNGEDVIRKDTSINQVLIIIFFTEKLLSNRKIYHSWYMNEQINKSSYFFCMCFNCKNPNKPKNLIYLTQT